MNAVRIFEISNGGISTHRWLCPEHVQARTDAKWSVKPGASVPHDLPCDDCLHEAPPDNRPVDFATTSEESRLPTRAEVAGMPGAAPMKPWPTTERRKEKAA